MKSIFRILTYILPFLLVFNSCRVSKRIYTDGSLKTKTVEIFATKHFKHYYNISEIDNSKKKKIMMKGTISNKNFWHDFKIRIRPKGFINRDSFDYTYNVIGYNNSGDIAFTSKTEYGYTVFSKYISTLVYIEFDNAGNKVLEIEKVKNNQYNITEYGIDTISNIRNLDSLIYDKSSKYYSRIFGIIE